MNQAKNTVWLTDELHIFNQIKGNRPPNPKHIKNLSNSIKQNGVLQSPIIVNENYDVIDGQHRLLAAKQSKSSIYYIIVDGYNLNEVQLLNLNQKNWSKEDFMNGYADMGIEAYVKLRSFYNRNREFSLTNCIAMCSNLTNAYSNTRAYATKVKTSSEVKVFEEGTWEGKDFELAQINADRIKRIKPYYTAIRKPSFVATFLDLLSNPSFNYEEFMHKLNVSTIQLDDRSNVKQYKLLIEEIYNYKRRDKVNLRF